MNWGMFACGMALFFVCYLRQFDEEDFLDHMFTAIGMLCAIAMIYFSKGNIWK